MISFKKYWIFILLFFSFYAAESQILEPVKWSFSSKKTGDAEAELILTATIDKGWHLYSQNIPDNGPVPTEFVFEKNKNYSLSGKVTEPKPITEKDPNFDNMVLKYFAHKAIFIQKIKILSDKAFNVKGTVSFMCCNDVSCLPPNDVTFKINVEGTTEVIQKDTNQSDSIVKSKKDSANLIAKDTINKGTLNGDDNNVDKMGLWSLFFFAFLAGLAAIITPCVFPMIPMTVSFFMHEGESRVKSIIKAIVFGLSIILIYTVIGTIVSVTLGVNFANFLSTHWIPNVLFFLIFIIFAASFFGMFEITLPGWMINKTDKQADKGGIIGSFFMAFTLVLVSFSCTGPLVGAILVKSASGQVLEPIIGMLGFSIAFALPFTLFAFFPSWLTRLPKSGGWLNSVKVVLGFLELALGLKFLSIADQTYHWGILDREVYLAFWIVIFTLMGFYLLGKIKFVHDSEVKHIGVPRLTLAIITFAFVAYMIPGMFGAPLKVLSGYMPPQQSLDFDFYKIVRENSAFYNSKVEDNEICETPKYSEFLHLPHGLKGFFDFEQGVNCARLQNKPVFIDFTGHGCVNCREMEANVWSDPRVLKILREDYLIITLYVDDKKELEQSEWVTSKYDGQIKKTIGKKFADFQIYFFNVNAQPYYVLLDPFVELKDKTVVEKAKLTNTKAYDLDPDNFVKFLKQGVEEFKKRHPGN